MVLCNRWFHLPHDTQRGEETKFLMLLILRTCVQQDCIKLFAMSILDSDFVDKYCSDIDMLISTYAFMSYM